MRMMLAIGAGLALGANANAQWLLQGSLKAKEFESSQHFGVSIEVDGDRMIVGAAIDLVHGAAFIFERVDGEWQETAKLVAEDPQPFAFFGFGVAIDGDTAVIGAPRVDGQYGAAYVFELVDGAWEQTQKLVYSEGFLNEYYGVSVGIDGDAIAVGADDGAYTVVYDRIDGVWEESQSFPHPGWSLSIDEGTLVVGEPSQGGVAFVYQERNGFWSLADFLLPDDLQLNDWFGYSVDVDGDTIVVGSWKKDYVGDNSGAAYVYRDIDGDWEEIAILASDELAAGDVFGTDVAIHADTIVVGATDVEIDFLSAGATYVFREIAGDWTQIATLTKPEPGHEDFFGLGIDIQDGVAFVGAHLDDSLETDSGAVYIFAEGCAGDFNADGALDVLDFVAFQVAYLAMDMAADCDANGAFNVIDFVCFQGVWQAGCE